MGYTIFLTGNPGIDKTSVLLRVIKVLKARGLRVGGMISQEFREGSTRLGVRILDLDTGKEGWLSHINQKTGPRVGKHRVNLRDLRKVGVESILRAIEVAEIIVIDEVGPMELCSSTFRDAVICAMQSRKTIIGILHFRAQDPLIDLVKTAPNTEIYEVTYENRQQLHEKVVSRIIKQRSKKCLS